MIQTLIKNDNYNGKFVAFKSFEDHFVVGKGITAQQARKEAEGKGLKDPVIAFVPIKGVSEIY